MFSMDSCWLNSKATDSSIYWLLEPCFDSLHVRECIKSRFGTNESVLFTCWKSQVRWVNNQPMIPLDFRWLETSRGWHSGFRHCVQHGDWVDQLGIKYLDIRIARGNWESQVKEMWCLMMYPCVHVYWCHRNHKVDKYDDLSCNNAGKYVRHDVWSGDVTRWALVGTRTVRNKCWTV